MDSDSSILKRKYSSESSPSPKRRLIEESPISILDFSDCVLLEILKHLDATSLYSLSLTCRRFAVLVEDQSLWLYIDGRSRPNTNDKIEFCWKHVNDKTKHLFLAADSRSQFILSRHNMFSNDKHSSLTILVLEHQCIKYSKLSDFPKTLEEISFRHSFIPRHTSFFRFSEKAMSNLRTLILDHCQWLDADCLTSFCKYPKLEILSLYMCKKLGEDDIANISIAGRFGFRNIKVLDVRFTGFGDLFIKAFCMKPSIIVVYFQCISTTYHMERYQRQLDLLNGASVDENSYMSDDDSNDTTGQSLKRRFQATRLKSYDMLTIKDDSMMAFSQLKKCPIDFGRPKSVLYKYPYSTCTCRHKTKETSNETPETKQLQLKLQLEELTQKENRARRFGNLNFSYPKCKTVCSNLTFDSCLIPNWCQTEATPTLPIQKWLFAREPKNDFEIAMLENTDKHFQTRVMHRCTLECPFSSLCDPFQQGFNVREHNPSHTYSNFMKTLGDGIILLRNASNPKAEVQNVTKRIIQIFFKELHSDDSQILEDSAYLEEISVIIEELATKIMYDVKHVLNYHLTCFCGLWRFRQLQKTHKENLKTFFYNLLMSETKENLGKTLPEPSDSDIEPPDNESIASTHLPTTLYIRRIIAENEEPERVRGIPRRLIVYNPAYVTEKRFLSVIRELSFRGYSHITDASLMQLRDLELDLLDVTGTSITEQGAQQFISYNPQCWFIHESQCVCRPNLHF